MLRGKIEYRTEKLVNLQVHVWNYVLVHNNSERILELPPDILEAVLYLLEIVLPVVIEDV